MTEEDKKLHILLSTDGNYIMPSGVMMKSVSINNSNIPMEFHVMIDDSVTQKQKEQLQKVLINSEHKITFHLMNGNLFKHYPALGTVKSYLSKAAYYRLFVTDIIEGNIHKILYLDGDIIVTHSLLELWKVNISDYALGAVTDMAEGRQEFERLGYAADEGYFNSGVLLINLDYWREHNLKDKFIDLIVKHPEKIKLHDQDVLNIVLHDKKLILPMKYNVQNGFLWKKEYNQFGERYDDYEIDLKEAIANPTIIHFTDNKKPWHTEDCNPLGYEWFKYYKQTEWKYQPLGHCNKSKVRYWGAKILRSLKLLQPALTDETYYFTLEEIKQMHNQNETANIMD